MIQEWNKKYFVTSQLTGKILGEWNLKKDAMKHLKAILKNQYHAPKIR